MDIQKKGCCDMLCNSPCVFFQDGKLLLKYLDHHDLGAIGHLAAGFGFQTTREDGFRAVGATLGLVGRRNVLEITVREFDDNREFRG